MLQFFMMPSQDTPKFAAFKWRQTTVVFIACLVAARFSMGSPFLTSFRSGTPLSLLRPKGDFYMQVPNSGSIRVVCRSGRGSPPNSSFRPQPENLVSVSPDDLRNKKRASPATVRSAH